MALHVAGGAGVGVVSPDAADVAGALEQDDVVVTTLEDAVGTIDSRAGDVCQDCHRLILMADVAHRIGVGRLVASLDLTA